MKKLYPYIKPLIFSMGYEKGQKALLHVLRAISYKKPKKPFHENLRQNLWGRNYHSPVGIASGFDRDALSIAGIFHLGAGFVELGTVGPSPYKSPNGNHLNANDQGGYITGNIYDHSVGLDILGRRLASFRLAYEDFWGRVGVNITCDKDRAAIAHDLKTCVFAVGGMADFITFDLSVLSGVKQDNFLQTLKKLLEMLMEERENFPEQLPALLVKIPLDFDKSQITALCTILKETGVNGVVIGESVDAEKFPQLDAQPHDKVFGKPLLPKTLEVVTTFYKELKGDIPIIARGGIMNADNAYAAIVSGATFVQVYATLLLNGPYSILDMNKALSEKIKSAGFQNIEEAVGSKYK